jgi:hypothetical protein
MSRFNLPYIASMLALITIGVKTIYSYHASSRIEEKTLSDDESYDSHASDEDEHDLDDGYGSSDFDDDDDYTGDACDTGDADDDDGFSDAELRRRVDWMISEMMKKRPDLLVGLDCCDLTG